MRRAPRAAMAMTTVALAALAAISAPAAAQRVVAPSRLEIAAVGDSTITLRVGQAGWLRANQRGMVVDPRQRDALVARFRVLSVTGDSAVALLTGMTSPVVRQHVALMTEPRRRWFTEGLFWAGAALGAALGVAAGLSL